MIAMEKKITPEMTVEEVITRWPQTIKVMIKFGIPALVCGEPLWGTIGENAEKYGVKDIDKLIEELNKAAGESSLFVKLE